MNATNLHLDEIKVAADFLFENNFANAGNFLMKNYCDIDYYIQNEDTLIRKAFQETIDKNTMVISQSDKYHISKKLIYLTLSYLNDDVDVIYIPKDSYPEFNPFETLYGITFIRTEFLNWGNEMYSDLQRSISGYENFIAAVGKNSSIIGAS